VIGGLVRDVLQNEVDGVPLLSDLPIIGTLFQTKSISHQKAELVIFITPTLIED
jgi:type II secretory pathway component GspD/PulD (secretin)